MAQVCEYPDDPLKTLPTSDPYVRRAVFGEMGLVTYQINDATKIVIVIDFTWAG